MVEDTRRIRLVGKWSILMEGDERIFALFPCHRAGLDYLMLRLFQGEEVALTALEHYNIAVRHLGDGDEVITVPQSNEPSG